jgi:hypothetical protein
MKRSSFRKTTASVFLARRLYSIIALFFFLFFALTTIISTTSSAAPPAISPVCATTGGLLNIHDSSGSSEDIDQCETQPDTQIIIFHKISFCTSSPTAPTSSTIIDRSMCTEYFSNDAGSVATVQKGVSNAIAGTITDIPSGSYTHALVEMGTSFSYTSTFNFKENATDADGNNASTTCVTKKLPEGSARFLYQTGFFANKLAASNVTCVEDVAADATEVILNALSHTPLSDLPCTMSHDYVGTDSTVPVFLIKSDEKLASEALCNGTSNNSVHRLIGFLPVNIKWAQGAGQKVKIRYNNSRGITIYWSGTNSIEYAQISYFDFTITSRTPRTRSWR